MGMLRGILGLLFCTIIVIGLGFGIVKNIWTVEHKISFNLIKEGVISGLKNGYQSTQSTVRIFFGGEVSILSIFKSILFLLVIYFLLLFIEMFPALMFRWKFPSLLILLFSIIVWFGLGFFGGNVLSMIRTVEDEVIINQTTNKTMGAVVSLI